MGEAEVGEDRVGGFGVGLDWGRRTLDCDIKRERKEGAEGGRREIHRC